MFSASWYVHLVVALCLFSPLGFLCVLLIVRVVRCAPRAGASAAERADRDAVLALDFAKDAETRAREVDSAVVGPSGGLLQ
jgi:hypothetical protein